MRYKIVVEYDGTGFFGWQRQQERSNVTELAHLSVQQVLEDALYICQKERVVVQGSGRTDTGVHAVGQVAHFDLSQDVEPYVLLRSLNALVVPHPVCVRALERVSDDFHARFGAKQRFYLYKIQNTLYPPVLNKNRVCHVSHPLDVEAMNQAAQLLIGKHDFSTFRASECQAKSPVKTLDEIRVWREQEMVYIEVAARSFLHHQVRNIAGSLLLVGRGKWDVSDFKKALDACDRTKGGPTAVPYGLYFMSVRY